MEFQLVKRRDNGVERPVFYMYWRDKGRPRFRSTGCRDREEAERWLADYVSELSRPADRPHIDRIIDGYLNSIAENRVRSLGKISSHLKPVRLAFGAFEPQSVHADLVQNITQNWRISGTSNGTIRTRLLYLRAALSWAQKRRWINEAPHIDAPPPGKARTRFLSRAEFESLYEAAQEIHLRTFIAIGVYTGLRSGAILSLTWDNLDLENMIIIPKGGTANKRRAKVPINTPLALALGTAWLNRQGPFIVHWKGNPISSVKKSFHSARRHAGIDGLIIHDLRRTSASWMAMAGIPMQQIAAMLGDSVTITEKHYAHLSPGYLRSAAMALE